MRTNKIEYPKHLGELESLEVLDMRGNRLDVLPDDLWQLKNLRRLDLSYNYFYEMPEEIRQLENLEWINLEQNPMTAESKNKLKQWFPNARIYTD